ncbi:MAG: hypothetical protein LBJ10_04995 [Clostridiales bacterium]|nr:hypothetical protein [Clostridiales bacterium]
MAAYQQTNDPSRAYRIAIDSESVTFSGELGQIAAAASRRAGSGTAAYIKLRIRAAGLFPATAQADREYAAEIKGGAATIELGALPDGQYYLTYGVSGGEAEQPYGTMVQAAVVEGGRLALSMPTAYAANKASAGGYAPPAAGELLAYKEYSGAIAAKAAEITADARDRYHAAKLINTWVANNIYYDIDEVRDKAPHSQSPAVVFRDRTAICYGFANMTQALLNAAGIQARSTVGTTANGEHSWTEAYIDGRWVFMDSTWESSNRYYGSSGMYRRGAEAAEDALRYFDMTIEYLSEAYVYGSPPVYSEPAPASTAALTGLPALWPSGAAPAPNSSVAAALLPAGAQAPTEAGQADGAQAEQSPGTQPLEPHGSGPEPGAGGGLGDGTAGAGDSGAGAGLTRAAASAAVSATPTASAVLVNGKPAPRGAYNIGGSNYFRLRDLALALSGTQKRFEVEWDAASNAIRILRGKSYTPVGGEMAGAATAAGAGAATGAAGATATGTGAATGAAGATGAGLASSAGGAGAKAAGNAATATVPVPAIPTPQSIFIDGKAASLAAYSIGGANYFKLRDVGTALDFGVEWRSSDGAVLINTATGYTPG